MMSLKEKYWQYSLIVIILGLGIVIFREALPFMSGILGALTVYILVRRQMRHLLYRKKWKRPLAAAALLLETVLLFLVPLGLIIWLIVERLEHIHINLPQILESVEQLSAYVQQKVGYDLLNAENLKSAIAFLPSVGQTVMGGVTHLAINVLIMLFLLYFMLTGGERMEQYFREILPFSNKNVREVFSEVNLIVKSNAIGIPLLAIIQGCMAVLGYWIFGIPNMILWGILSAFSTVIPIVGTGLVWIPLALYLGITGQWGHAIGLAAYCLLVVGNVDNLARFLLQKKLADTHPLITIFGVILGLKLFGFLGVIFGPLMLSMFLLCLDIFKNEYLERKFPGRPLLDFPERKTKR